MSEQRHGTLEELLLLRDGEGSAWAREHVALCVVCAAELERLEQVRSQLRAPGVRAAARPVAAHRAVGAAGAAAPPGIVVVRCGGGGRCSCWDSSSCGIREPRRRTPPCARRWRSRRRWSRSSDRSSRTRGP